MTKRRKFLPAILVTLGIACWCIIGNAQASTTASLSHVSSSLEPGDYERAPAPTRDFPAFADSGAAMPIVLARLSEKSIPPASMPSGTGSPSPSPSPESSPAPHSGWQRVPESPSATPNSSGNGASTTENGSSQAEPQDQNPSPAAMASPGATASPGLGEGASAGENSAGNSTPPPAIDITTLTPTKDLSDTSLDSEIANADTPALAASLRLTEQARQEIDNQHPNAAIRTLGRAISIDAGDPFAYFFLGRAYLAKSNYAQALTFFQRAEIGFGARPEWLSESISFEGACEEELGQLTKAAHDYERALTASPNNLMARVGYTRLAAYLPNVNPANQPGPASNGPPPPPSGSIAAPPPAESPPPAAPVPASSSSRWKTLGNSPSQ